jgi:hypothetical protein
LISKDGQSVPKLVTTSLEFIAILALTGFTILTNSAAVKCSLQVRKTEVYSLAFQLYEYENTAIESVTFYTVSCVTADWILSFDKQGWSKCTGENTFITGFYRSEKKGNDGIYRLEKARCCIASPQYQGESGVCVDENWWGILDK